MNSLVTKKKKKEEEEEDRKREVFKGGFGLHKKYLSPSYIHQNLIYMKTNFPKAVSPNFKKIQPNTTLTVKHNLVSITKF